MGSHSPKSDGDFPEREGVEKRRVGAVGGWLEWLLGFGLLALVCV